MIRSGEPCTRPAGLAAVVGEQVGLVADDDLPAGKFRGPQPMVPLRERTGGLAHRCIPKPEDEVATC